MSFPYPYMNGKIHLGHAFSLSKTEFAVGFWRLMGRHCLFPLAFHCTGMPIKACADKLKAELEHEHEAEEAPATVATAVATAQPSFSEGKLGVFRSNKVWQQSYCAHNTICAQAKATAKKGTGTSQYEIMQKMGIPESEIPKFADSLHWLHYFPNVAKVCISASWREIIGRVSLPADRPPLVWRAVRLATLFHYDKREPLLRQLHQMAVPQAPRDEPHPLRQAVCTRLFTVRLTGLLGVG